MKLRYLLMVVSTGLLVAPAAFAAGSAPSGYGGGAGVQNEVGGVQSAGGTLPFTGLDLALLVIGGLMLLVVGMVLRRAVRRTT